MQEETQVISSYSQEQAIEDGVLVELFKNRWGSLSGGKPIMASRAIFDTFSLAEFLEIWNDYVVWKREVGPTLPEEDKTFVTKMNDRKVWVIDDGSAFTIMFPEDY